MTLGVWLISLSNKLAFNSGLNAAASPPRKVLPSLAERNACLLTSSMVLSLPPQAQGLQADGDLASRLDLHSGGTNSC